MSGLRRRGTASDSIASPRIAIFWLTRIRSLAWRRCQMTRFPVSVSLVFFAASSIVFGQSYTNDPRAVAMAARSIAALTHGSPVGDVRLTADVTWVAGPDAEMGSGVM